MPQAEPAAPAPTAAPDAARGAAADRRRWRRVLLWGLLIGLLAVAQALLVALVLVYEDTRAQDRTDRVAAASAAELRQHLLRSLQTLQILVWSERSPQQWRAASADLLGARPELVRVELRDAGFAILDAVQAPHLQTLFSVIPRPSQSLEAQAACDDARRAGSPAFSRSYFVPLMGGGAWS
jgi:two-component system sensor histidine kinase DctS